MKCDRAYMADAEYWDENYVLKDENRFPLTGRFWDCECEANYIHPKSTAICPRCGAVREERPDSRINEVLGLLMANPDVSQW